MRRSADPSVPTEGGRTFRHKLAFTALLLAVLGTAFGLFELATLPGHRAVPSATPAFLTKALGAPQRSASLVRKPAPHLRVAIGDHGFTYASDGLAALGIAATGLTGGPWKRYAHGTLRTTPFGHEAVTVNGSLAEHLITVDRHVGKHVWTWQLNTFLRPRVSPNGYVGFIDPATHRLLDLNLLPVKIFDGSGKDVTPKGSHWSLSQNAKGSLLTLALDDSKLSLPYTIDPMASRGFAESAAIGVTPLTTSALPATVQTGDLIIVHVAVTAAATITAPTVNGVTMTNTLTASNASSFTKQQTWWSRATSTDFSKTVGASWTGGGNGGVTVAVYAGMDSTSPALTTGTAYTSVATNANFRLANASIAVGSWPQNHIGIGFAAIAANNAFATAPAMSTPVGNFTQRNERNSAAPFAIADWDYTCATVGGCAYTSVNVSSGANTSRSVGNLVVLRPDGTVPSADTLSLNKTANPTLQYFDNSTFNSGNQTCATATCYYYYSVPGGASSTFTVNSVPVDAQSGPNQVAFPTLATTGFTGTGGTTNYQSSGTYTSGVFTVASTNLAAPGNATVTASDDNSNNLNTTLTFVRDVTAPAGGAFSANGVAATGGGSSSYITAGTTLTINSRTDYTETESATAAGLLSSTLTMATGTLSGNTCSGYGAPATIAGTTSQTVASGNCYLLTLTGTDNVGNAATLSTTVKVDSTNPSAPGSFSFSGLSANAYWPGAGSIVYFQPGIAGSFTATASGATDADTGIASYNYGAVAGTGWSNAAGAYSYTTSSTTGTGAVTATNGAGLTGSSTSFTAQADSTAPTGGAVTANGTAASIGGTSSYVTAGTTLTINSRTDFAETQTATASGLASSVLTMQTASLTGNTCGGYGAPSTITGTTSQTVASGNCYLLILKGTDNVGNSASVRTTVMVDTTAPSAPSAAGFGFSSLTNAYFPGSGSIVYVKGGSAGGFTASASGATDADTGIASYTYGAIAGTGWSNAAGAFTFTAASPTGTSSVTATNGAGTAGSGTTFTAQSDSTAPTGGAFTANSTAATGGGSTSFLTAGTTLTINSRTDYAETQTATASGLASSTLTMATGTLSGNTCSGYGAPATITGTTSQTVASGNCYLLTLTGTDNVGNAATLTTTVKVDTTAPSAPSAAGFSFGSLTNAYWPGGSSATVYTKSGSAGGFTVTASGSTDADTNVASYNYGAVAGTGWSNAAGAYTFTGASPTGTGAVTATNGAGLTGSATNFN
ncbi:MAG TPA: hypothetical protein VGN27_07390, partial [Gaiellaceae bacterium]|nr:hypothetical protein [Gaiellaceae bacterium]